MIFGSELNDSWISIPASGAFMTKHRDLENLVQACSIAIFDALGDAISIQDKEFRILYQNSAHIDMMGYHHGEYCYAAYQGKNEVCPG